MGAGKILPYIIDLDLDLIPNLGSGDEDHKPFDPGEAVALLGDVLNLYIVLLTYFYWSG